jgi:hypothetical protein
VSSQDLIWLSLGTFFGLGAAMIVAFFPDLMKRLRSRRNAARPESDSDLWPPG